MTYVPTALQTQLPTVNLHEAVRPAAPRSASDDLVRRVSHTLAASNIPALRDVRVNVAGDIVVLSGEVQTFYQRQMAAQFAQRVSGVVRLDDRLQVRGYVPRHETGRYPVDRGVPRRT